MTKTIRENKVEDCSHVFRYKGAHVTGEETQITSVPLKTLVDVYYCEKCLEEKRKPVTHGYHIRIPQGATTSGYGFDR